MEDIYVIEHIKEFLKERNWSNYKLAQQSGLSKETINKMLRENHVPSINSLIKICNGFGISLAQFFAEIETPNDEQTQLISLWNRLSDEDKYNVKVYICGLLKQQALLRNIDNTGSENDDI